MGELPWSLRDATEADSEALYAIYASTRRGELGVTGWDEATQEAFLRHQFNAQRTDYLRNYANAAFQVIEIGGRIAGRLYLFRDDRDINILDIALLPEFRSKGIGGDIIAEVQREAAQIGKTVSIWVEFQNRAAALYERLGFITVADQGVYRRMLWSPT